MITVGMNYRVLPGKEQTFEIAFAKVVTAIRNAAGHSVSRLYREVENESHYLIISEWFDRAAFEAFIASDAFRKVTDWGAQQILAGRPHHEVYEN